MPLSGEGHDLLQRIVGEGEENFGDGQDFRKAVAPQRDVEFPAVDELFDQRRLMVGADAVVDLLAEGLAVVTTDANETPKLPSSATGLTIAGKVDARRTLSRPPDDFEDGGVHVRRRQQRPLGDQLVSGSAHRQVGGAGVRKPAARSRRGTSGSDIGRPPKLSHRLKITCSRGW